MGGYLKNVAHSPAQSRRELYMYVKQTSYNGKYLENIAHSPAKSRRELHVERETDELQGKSLKNVAHSPGHRSTVRLLLKVGSFRFARRERGLRRVTS